MLYLGIGLQRALGRRADTLMFRDYTVVLWVLKLGSLINLYFLVSTRLLASGDPDTYIVLPAQILFAVSAYRCLFPVRYEHNVVFHDSIFSFDLRDPAVRHIL